MDMLKLYVYAATLCFFMLNCQFLSCDSTEPLLYSTFTLLCLTPTYGWG